VRQANGVAPGWRAENGVLGGRMRIAKDFEGHRVLARFHKLSILRNVICGGGFAAGKSTQPMFRCSKQVGSLIADAGNQSRPEPAEEVTNA
jgi:hypothetical protein